MKIILKRTRSFGKYFYEPDCNDSRLLRDLIYGKKEIQKLTHRHFEILRKLK